MSDLISRQDAIALIKLKMHERKTPFTSMEVGFWHGMIFCIEALANMPSAESGWQPIDTAPKDGTWILLSGGEINYGWDHDDVPPCVVGQCSIGPHGETFPSQWQFAWYDSGYYGEYENPTHWMPLPEHPK